MHSLLKKKDSFIKQLFFKNMLRENKVKTKSIPKPCHPCIIQVSQTKIALFFIHILPAHYKQSYFKITP